VAKNSGYGIIFLAAHTFANCVNADKAELRTLKEGIGLSAPSFTHQLILRVIVQLLYML
jgi:hypothetical protein